MSSTQYFPAFPDNCTKKRIQLQNQNQCFSRFKLVQEPGDSVMGQRGKNIPLLVSSRLGFAPQGDELGSTGHPVPFVHHPLHEAEAAPVQESKDKP